MKNSFISKSTNYIIVFNWGGKLCSKYDDFVCKPDENMKQSQKRAETSILNALHIVIEIYSTTSIKTHISNNCIEA